MFKTRSFHFAALLSAALILPGMFMTTDSSGAAPNSQTTTASGLKYEDVKVGTGDAAEAGKTVSVHYTGWLTDGKIEDNPSNFPWAAGASSKDGTRA
jgi:hypothetical protein